jgi:hypothetical protein
MFDRRSFGIERIIVLLLRSLTVLDYFCVRFYIGSRITILGIFFNIRYSWEIFNNCRDLSKKTKV